VTLQQPSIVLSEYTTEVAFSELEAPWGALVSRLSAPSVFLSPEWFNAAWLWRRDTSTLALLSAQSEGQLVGVIPLVEARRASRTGPRRVLEFLTVPDTQFCDVVSDAEFSESVIEAFADWLVASPRRWDVLDLGFLPEDSLVKRHLGPALARRGRPVRFEHDGSNPYLDLDEPWEQYYAGRSRSLKKANNLASNRIGKAGAVTIDRYRPDGLEAHELDSWLRTLVSVSARSWKRESGNSLDNAGPQAFIRRLSELAARKGWLSLWILSLDGKPLAMEYQLIFNGNVHALRADFDADYGEISPGSHLYRVLLEALYSQALARYYMGPGDNPYKLRWTDKSVPLSRFTAYSGSPRGWVASVFDDRLVPIARAVRGRLRRQPAESSEQS